MEQALEASPATVDLAVRGGTVILETGVAELDLGIADGKIVSIADRGRLGPAAENIDATGHLVLPGGIDAHTHIQWPFGPNNSLRSKDTFRSATEAAAVSGTTSVIDFVPPPSGETHLAAAHRRLEEAAGHSAIDYSFHPMLRDAAPQTLRDIGELARLGMPSFKIFTAIENMRLDDGELYAVMEAIKGAGGLASFHAENEGLVQLAQRRTIAAEGPTIAAFPRTRPALAEAAAIGLVALYAREIGVPIYIVHATSRTAVESIRRARAEGTAIRAETCTHYLVFDESVYSRDNGWMYVILPPIRDADSRDALWAALADGTLSCISSDHCAYGYDQKKPGFADFRAMPGGSPGVDARFPVSWASGVSTGRLAPIEFARLTSTEPARTFGLYPRKGVIQVGADADLVVLDPDLSWTWPTLMTGWGSEWDPFSGFAGRGLPTLTIVRGRLAARDGRFVGDHGGQFIPRAIDTSRWTHGL